MVVEVQPFDDVVEVRVAARAEEENHPSARWGPVIAREVLGGGRCERTPANGHGGAWPVSSPAQLSSLSTVVPPHPTVIVVSVIIVAWLPPCTRSSSVASRVRNFGCVMLSKALDVRLDSFLIASHDSHQGRGFLSGWG